MRRSGLVMVVVLGGCAVDPKVPEVSEDAAVDSACLPPEGSQAQPAQVLDFGTSEAGLICGTQWLRLPGDVGQWVAVTVQANRPVRVVLGTAEMLLDEGTGRAVRLRSPVPPGGLRLGITPVDSAAPVQFSVTVDESLAECGDPGEPDTVDQPRLIQDRGQGVVCPGDHDFFAVEGPPGAQVEVQAALLTGTGVNLEAVRAVGGHWRTTETGSDRLVRLMPPSGQAVWRVVPVGGGGAYALTVRVEGTGASARVSAHGESADRAVSLEGLGPLEWSAAAGVLYDVVHRPTGLLAGLGEANEDGAIAIDFAGPEGGYALRMRAETFRAGRRVVVGPEGGTPWAEVVTELSRETQVLPDAVRPSIEGALLGAAHIAAVVAEGMTRSAPFLGVGDRAVRFQWNPGGGPACGSCYRPALDQVELSGRVTDPDEWDDAVILHELGHHLAAVYGRDDSPGGRHGGAPVEPALAWSEGFASFHAAWQLGSPVLLDYRASNTRQLDLETMDKPEATGVMNGLVSEYLVAAVLWDLYDGGEADDDAAVVPEAVLLTTAFAGLHDAEADLGAPGIDLEDYLALIGCEVPGLSTVLAARAYPGCRAKAGEWPNSASGLPWVLEGGAAVLQTK